MVLTLESNEPIMKEYSTTRSETMKTKLEKAIELLLGATQESEELDRIYDFVFASFSANEAQEFVNECRIAAAMRHYESL